MDKTTSKGVSPHQANEVVAKIISVKCPVYKNILEFIFFKNHSSQLEKFSIPTQNL